MTNNPVKVISQILFCTLFLITLGCKVYEANHSEHCGIILPAEAELTSSALADFVRFTPSSNDVYEAERIFDSHYKKISISASSSRKRDLNKYCRQYIGLISSQGDTLLMMNFLNVHGKGVATEDFDGWRSKYFIGFGDFYERNTIRYMANLSDATITVW